MKNKTNIYSPLASVETNVHTQNERGKATSAKPAKKSNRLLVFAIIITLLNILVVILKAKASESGLSWDIFYRLSRVTVALPFWLAVGAQIIIFLLIKKNIFFYVYLGLSILILFTGIIFPFII